MHLGCTDVSHLFNALCSGIKLKCENARDVPKQHGLVTVWCPSGYLQVLVMMEIPGILLEFWLGETPETSASHRPYLSTLTQCQFLLVSPATETLQKYLLPRNAPNVVWMSTV